MLACYCSEILTEAEHCNGGFLRSDYRGWTWDLICNGLGEWRFGDPFPTLACQRIVRTISWTAIKLYIGDGRIFRRYDPNMSQQIAETAVWIVRQYARRNRLFHSGYPDMIEHDKRPEMAANSVKVDNTLLAHLRRDPNELDRWRKAINLISSSCRVKVKSQTTTGSTLQPASSIPEDDGDRSTPDPIPSGKRSDRDELPSDALSPQTKRRKTAEMQSDTSRLGTLIAARDQGQYDQLAYSQAKQMNSKFKEKWRKMENAERDAREKAFAAERAGNVSSGGSEDPSGVEGK